MHHTIALFMAAFVICSITAYGQNDSLIAKAHAGFDKVSRLHRFLFGENYRREWSAETQLPVIHISTFKGGLRPVKEGGGNQTHSLRLVDKQGKEWVLRSVEKYPDAILPDNLKKTFVKDVVSDAMSAQHPYSALIVPVIAEAVKVPHAHPLIGIVAPDSLLGVYSNIFSNTICLLEEREPLGKSENYTEMLEALNKDNDNSFDSTTFLRARILDVFLGDWDRHLDQWRFKPETVGNGKRYTGIPRDRDQVFYTNQGMFPYLESRPYVQPFFEGFNPEIRNVGTLLFTSTMLNVRLLNQFSHEQWMKITSEFVSEISDSVLLDALAQLPKSSYEIRHDDLFKILKQRRADLPRAMSAYYFFLNKRPYIETSDKNEFVEVRDTLDHDIQVNIFKLSDVGEIRQIMFSKRYDHKSTKEVWFYIRKGSDSILVNNRVTPIRLHFEGGAGKKNYRITASKAKTVVSGLKNNVVFFGDTNRIKKRLYNDSVSLKIRQPDLFNVFAPLITGGYNPDDGVMLGLTLSYYQGISYKTSSFSTKNYSGLQQINFSHSFATSAFNARYLGEWKRAIGKADLIIRASAYSPDNTQNFFGTGNETEFIKSGDYSTYYRSQFDLYKLYPALRWGGKKGNYLTVGPSFELYTYDSLDNIGRNIASPGVTQTYDSATLSRTKAHGGVVIEFCRDKRDSRVLPTRGYSVNSKLQGYVGMNRYSESFGQLFADFAGYKSLDKKNILVLADRLGAGVTVGNEAFYQSMFLGGQGNLLGFRQYRWAGKYMVFNNLEARFKLAELNNYVVPGQLGLIGFYDIGRVWEKHDHSNQWHRGTGGGIYFSPAQIALVQFVISYSSEGWYPILSFGFRF